MSDSTFENFITACTAIFKTAVKNISDYMQIGQQNISIKILQTRISSCFRELGEYVNTKISAGAVEILAQDHKITELTGLIKSLENDIARKHQEIKNIKLKSLKK